MKNNNSKFSLKTLKICSWIFIIMLIFTIGDILGNIFFENTITLKTILLMLTGTCALIITRSKIKKINT